MQKKAAGKNTIGNGWVPPGRPGFSELTGQYARLERLEADKHAAEIHSANSQDNTIWDYMAYGPFPSAGSYHRWMQEAAARDDPSFYAIRNLESGHFEGVASYLRIKPEMGVIEVGNICFSPALQRSRAASEAMFLMMQWAFEAGYRRYEWKCDARNLASRRAAQRYGLSFEGIFRQHMIIKGRNRDTAWYAAIDSEWPALKAAYETWLDPANFDEQGRQAERLSDLTRPLRVSDDPALAVSGL